MHCTHENRQGIIDAYLHNQLSENEREKFEEHYFECQSCFSELQFTKTLADLIRAEGKGLLAAKPGLIDLILQWLKKRADSKTGRDNSTNYIDRYIPGFAKPVFISAFAVLVFFIGLSVYKQLNESPFDVYIYAERVPYVYHASSSRGISDRGQNPLEIQIQQEFIKAMVEYNDLCYENARFILDDLQPSVADIQASLNDADDPGKEKFTMILKVINDYYFYRGLVQLALARGGQSEKTRNLQDESLAKAVLYLQAANKIEPAPGEKDASRENFFLGLGYALQGDNSKSRNILQRIKPGQEFFEESRQLMNKLGGEIIQS